MIFVVVLLLLWLVQVHPDKWNHKQVAVFTFGGDMLCIANIEFGFYDPTTGMLG
jgi:hypothetical protein